MITGRTGEWEIVIGIEVHAWVGTQSKLSSSSAALHDIEIQKQLEVGSRAS